MYPFSIARQSFGRKFFHLPSSGHSHNHNDHHIQAKDLNLAVNPIDAMGPNQADSPALPNDAPGKENIERRALPDAQSDLHQVSHAAHDHDHDMSEEHSKIGVSLVTGFIFMLLVDQIGGSMHSHGGSSVSSTSSSSSSDLESGMVGVQNRNKMTATLGLVVHAAGV